ncbi:outer membrane protein assembly factor BamE [Gluconobacter cerinus]|uniref:outer membrane protein assembly factor BamE n=1 Tax=Gluconobacter cerinus TaxID=38307 RepID=UPI001B8D25DA|nr:outer membrane protein assembly factor BamE [Gluconobacter cerinus]MBS1018744.1 outer membrane protein assembly factor BamE [Gluconobacter cerinus]
MSARLLRTLAVTLSLTGLVALTGCASEGNEALKNETSASIDQKIHDGVTTKDQIRALFGDPRESTFTDSGHEQWRYAFTNASSDAANFIPLYGDLHQGTHGTEKTLTVIFNGDVVWHHTMNASAVKTGSGLF